MTGRKLRVMNFGSYNYLGFAENKELCATAVQEVTEKYGIGNAASRQELGQYSRPAAQGADTMSPHCTVCRHHFTSLHRLHIPLHLSAQSADTTTLHSVQIPLHLTAQCADTTSHHCTVCTHHFTSLHSVQTLLHLTA